MRGPARLATYLGRVMIGIGFLLLFVGWNGAAGLDYIQGQLPYVMSASLPGLGLVIIGLALEYVQTTRELTARRSRDFAELDAAMARLLGFVRDGGALAAATGELPTLPVAEHNLGLIDAAGHAFAPVRTLVAGRSSYHDATCHLVASRDDMTPISQEEALARGLSPCRICKP